VTASVSPNGRCGYGGRVDNRSRTRSAFFFTALREGPREIALEISENSFDEAPHLASDKSTRDVHGVHIWGQIILDDQGPSMPPRANLLLGRDVSANDTNRSPRRLVSTKL